MEREHEKYSDDDRVVDSSGNVFVDLGLPATQTEMVKISLAMEITNTIQKRGLTQTQVGKVLGVDQAKVSALVRGRLKDFSPERLVKYLLCLGFNVSIQISESHRDAPGRIEVRAA